MQTIAGYTTTHKLYESATTAIFRAIHTSAQQPVVLKLLKGDYPDNECLNRFIREYNLTSLFTSERIVKAYSLEKHHNSLVMVLEDFPGVPLADIISSGRPDLELFLDLAIQITEALDEIHQNNVLFKNLNPANILYNSRLKQLKIINFSNATQTSVEPAEERSTDMLDGSLSYLSPELTGRLNRTVDYRTDFYSLGVTLYQLITGFLPFETEEPIEIIHYHLAKTPPSPSEIDINVPHSVSAIILKLLEKSAVDRYQRCRGLLFDLHRCSRELATDGVVSTFSPGEKDISETLQVPSRLYGRHRELAALHDAFTRAKQGSTTLVMVTGHSGIGKTVLVDEFFKSITRDEAFFIHGKFANLDTCPPHAPIFRAIQQLIRHLLSKSNIVISQWKQQILEALGANSQVVIDIIPEVELITGPQPPVPLLTGTETEKRFNRTLSNFIRVFARSGIPLIFFLDDLQWADPASLQLLSLLLEERSSCSILFIGSYRSNELPPIHPLHNHLQKLTEEGRQIQTIALPCLNQATITHILSHTLHLQEEEVSELAGICLRKTGGNPLFLKQFLYSASRAGLLHFSGKKQIWQWDRHDILTCQLTKNIVDLLLQSITTFPPITQEYLKTAACLGSSFDLEVLSNLLNCPTESIRMALAPCLDDGLLLPAVGSLTPEGHHRLIFAHDQIQQAVLSLLSDTEKEKIHLETGRYLLNLTPAELVDKQIFHIVGHMNKGIKHITCPRERQELILANLRAGTKAKNSAAYTEAYKYLRTGLELLPENSWHDLYNQTLELHVECCDAAYLNGDYDEMERIFILVSEKATSMLDKCKVYSIRIRAMKARNLLSQAIETGLEILNLLSIRFPPTPSKLYILLTLAGTRLQLSRYSQNELLNFPEMENPKARATMELLADIGTAAYSCNPRLVPLIGCKAIQLSLQYGNCALSVVMGYPTYGFLLCSAPGDSIDSGYDFGQLSLQLQKKLTGGDISPKALYLVNNLINHWKDPLKTTLPPLKTAMQKCFEDGDLETSANAAYSCSYRLYFLGINLNRAESELVTYRDHIAHTGQQISLYRQQIYQQAISNLLGNNSDPVLLQGNYYNEEIMLPLHLSAGDGTTAFQVLLVKLIHATLFNRYQEALNYSEAATKHLQSVTASVFVPVFNFYDSLARLALYPESSRPVKILFRLKVRANQRRMRTWAKHAPANYRHKHELIEAEFARVSGKTERAMEYYDRAIHLAREHEYLHEEGLAYELAARFYSIRGQAHIARPYMREARYCYYCWGAIAKVKQLDGWGWSNPSQSTDSPLAPSTSPIADSGSSRLDMMTVIKASRTLTSEMVLDELLKKMMRIMLESAGAQRGFLIFQEGGEWRIKVRGSIFKNSVVSLANTPIESQSIASGAIIHYVIHTAQDVVLNDACREGLFTGDPYIVEKKPRSVLCMPIIHQDEIFCILYLENNLATGAFPPDRQELLTLLGTQASISLKNSRLFHELESTVDRLNTEVERRKDTQLQLMHAEKLTALGRLSASIAHEFGNPLMGVKYLIDDFHKRSDLNEGDRKLLELGLEECDRMKNLIRDLQQLHRPSSGEKTKVNLHKIIDNVLYFLKKHFSTHHITVTREFDTSPPMALVVVDQITQVLFNLTMNAVDAIPPEGGTITIATRWKTNGLLVHVTDTGTGIPKEDQDRIFEPFFSTKKEEDGTGLGLPISYGIVQHHGGTLTFTSEPGQGTTFTLFLPADPPNSPTVSASLIRNAV